MNLHTRITAAASVWLAALGLLALAAGRVGAGSLSASGTNGPGAGGPAGQWRPTALAISQKPVDFNHPPRDYATNRVRGWTVLVESQLAAEAPVLARRALERLDTKLGEAMAVLPEGSHARLRGLTLFLMYGEASALGGRDNGFEYFQRTAPRHYPHLDPRMAGSIVVYSATNFVWLSDFWALKALVHEFAHAHHLEQGPEFHAGLYDGWDSARKRGLYRNVTDERGRRIEQGYAIQNHLEYFAELSCMYFAGCNYAPTNRAALRAYDPAGCKLVEELWFGAGGAGSEAMNSRSNRPPPAAGGQDRRGDAGLGR